MSIVLHDLCGIDDRRFSPNCWRARMALAHKGLECDARGTRFTDIAMICGGGHKQIPVIEDGERIVAGSTAIADYLEEHYPERPSLFGGPAGRRLCDFVESWTTTSVHGGIARLIVLDIHDHLDVADRDYFRSSRESRFGRSLEEVQADRDQRIESLRQSLEPVRTSVGRHAFLGGDGPLYADYLVFGALQWARTVSPYPVLTAGDPVRAWFDRCLDLFDGLGRRATGYEWA